MVHHFSSFYYSKALKSRIVLLLPVCDGGLLKSVAALFQNGQLAPHYQLHLPNIQALLADTSQTENKKEKQTQTEYLIVISMSSHFGKGWWLILDIH